MLRFHNLIKNEFVKMFARPTLYIMLALIPLVSIFWGYIHTLNSVESRNSQFNSRDQILRMRISDVTTMLQDQNSQKGAEVGTAQYKSFSEELSALQTIREKDIALDSWQADALLKVAESIGADDSYGLPQDFSSNWQARVKQTATGGTLANYVDLLSERNRKILEINPKDQSALIEKDVLALRQKYSVEPINGTLNNQYGNERKSKNPKVFKNGILSTISSNKNSIAQNTNNEGGTLTKEQKKELENDIAIDTYRIEKGIPDASTNTMLGFLSSSSALVFVISLFVIIIAATQMASEYTGGTIKLFLVSPYKRWKLFFGKLTAVFLLAVVMLTLLFFSSLITGALFFGFSSTSPQLLIQNGKVVEVPFLVVAILQYLLVCPELMVMTSLAVMLAVVMRHSAVAIGVGVAAFFGSQIITQILTALNKDFIRFLLFFNTDLSRYFPNLIPVSSLSGMQVKMPTGMTFTFSLCVLAVHFICFTYIALDSFNRRDIK